MKTSNGVTLILAERERQIVKEGYSSAHDDRHVTGELQKAATCYEAVADGPSAALLALQGWPWPGKDWKPSEDPERNLVKAGALYMAEAERLERRGPSYTLSAAQARAAVKRCAERIDHLQSRVLAAA